MTRLSVSSRIARLHLVLLVWFLPAGIGVAQDLITWTSGTLTRRDLDAFLWGDGDRMLTAGGDDSPTTPTQEQTERLFLTQYAWQFFDAGGQAETTATRALVASQFDRYLFRRWLAREVEKIEAKEEPGFRRQYAQDPGSFCERGQFTLRRLYFPVPAGDVARRKEALAKAREAAAALKAGEPVERLIERYKLDPNCHAVAGPFEFGRINPVLDQAARRLKPGEVSDPLEVASGIQVVQLVSKTPVRVPSEAEARAAWFQRNLILYQGQALRELLPVESPPNNSAAEDQALMLFLGSRLARQVGPAESGAILRKAASLARAAGLHEDASARFVHRWIERRAMADQAFESALARKIGQPSPADFKKFYEQHLEYFKEKEKFRAEYFTLPAPGAGDEQSPAWRKAQALAARWRGGEWDPSDPAQAAREGVTFHALNQLVTIAEAGRQLHEAVRTLKAGEVGAPVYSQAKGTLLVARLLERPERKLKPFDPVDPELARLYQASRRCEFKDEFIRRAMEEGHPSLNLASPD